MVIAVIQKFWGQKTKVPVRNYKLPVTTFFRIDREISNLPVTWLEKMTDLHVTIFDNMPVKSQKLPRQNFTGAVSRVLLVVTGTKNTGTDETFNSFLHRNRSVFIYPSLNSNSDSVADKTFMTIRACRQLAVVNSVGLLRHYENGKRAEQLCLENIVVI